MHSPLRYFGAICEIHPAIMAVQQHPIVSHSLYQPSITALLITSQVDERTSHTVDTMHS